MTEHMSWDRPEQRAYSVGIDRGMLYIEADQWRGVPWSGLVSVSVNNTDGEFTRHYLDGQTFRISKTAREFGANVTAFTYPREFERCIGQSKVPGSTLMIDGQKPRRFHLSWRTKIGDGNGDQEHYKIHFAYNCLANVGDADYETINDSPKPGLFTFEIMSTPESMPQFKPTSYFWVDSRDLTYELKIALDGVLYGLYGSEPTLPLPDQLAALLPDV